MNLALKSKNKESEQKQEQYLTSRAWIHKS